MNEELLAASAQRQFFANLLPEKKWPGGGGDGPKGGVWLPDSGRLRIHLVGLSQYVAPVECRREGVLKRETDPDTWGGANVFSFLSSLPLLPPSHHGWQCLGPTLHPRPPPLTPSRAELTLVLVSINVTWTGIGPNWVPWLKHNLRLYQAYPSLPAIFPTQHIFNTHV